MYKNKTWWLSSQDKYSTDSSNSRLPFSSNKPELPNVENRSQNWRGWKGWKRNSLEKYLTKANGTGKKRKSSEFCKLSVSWQNGEVNDFKHRVISNRNRNCIQLRFGIGGRMRFLEKGENKLDNNIDREYIHSHFDGFYLVLMRYIVFSFRAWDNHWRRLRCNFHCRFSSCLLAHPFKPTQSWALNKPE